ncbi:MAG TPA: TOMM precursor leader peptide-binding protein [Terriglobia bacterium]|jgi:ribosomal protein S12 methylthiotransferase accessory factor
MENAWLNQPRLRKSLVIEVIEPRLMFALSEHRHFVFEGEIYPALLPFLHGGHSMGDILSGVADRFSLQDVMVAVQRLVASRCLVDSDVTDMPEQQAAFWDGVSDETNATAVAECLRDQPVTVRALGAINRDEFETTLRRAGVRVEPDGGMLIVATDDYLREELADLDSQARITGKPWVIVKPVGMIAWIGPLFRPGAAACWHCLEHRLRHNRQVELYLRGRSTDAIDISKTRFPSLDRSAMSLASIEIARLIALNFRTRLEGRIFALDFQTYKIEEHTVVRRPQCKACGQPLKIAQPGPVELKSRIKRNGAGGTERTASPEEIFHRYQHHISPISGIVTAFIPRNLEACGLIYNYTSGHYFPIISDDLASLQVNLIARSGGKGSDEIQAKAGAVAEALERYSGISWGEEYEVRGSFASLQPEAIRVEDVLFFSRNQYESRAQWNTTPGNEKHYVPEPFDEKAEIAWTPLWSLSHNRLRYLPKAFCFYGHRDAVGNFSFCDSNGCAAGNTLEEAIVHGFLELAERDAVAIWWYNRLKRSAVDASSFDLPYWVTLRDYYDTELQRDLHVIDITSDLGIPTFVAVSRRRDQPTEDIIIGIGCHFNPRKALMQALLEANQSTPLWHFVTRDRPALKRYCPKDIMEWLETATYENQPYLVPEATCPKTFADYKQMEKDDVREDVLTCVEIAKAAGLELLVLDQTRPGIGLPVARVVVPGLRHFWLRLAPGRLYDVPVRMGWLQKPLGEADMNRIPFFI